MNNGAFAWTTKLILDFWLCMVSALRDIQIWSGNPEKREKSRLVFGVFVKFYAILDMGLMIR